VAAGGALCGLYLEQRRHPPSPALLGDDVTSSRSERGDATSSQSVFAEAARQLEAYFDGRLTEFELPLAPAGTPFQLAVWTELLRIPYGETMTYGELAERLGRPSAARAVGAANGRNPISIVVPCHRLVGASGGLTGYGGGVDRKRRLLDLERRARYGTLRPAN
jgi:methylated-DNA-[protein]-cysteine S-methyltransferase